MSSTKYTLDRIEDGYAIFLKFSEEEEELVIIQSAMNEPVQVGDRVLIEEKDGHYHIEIVKEETEQKKADIQSLMNRLRNKQK